MKIAILGGSGKLGQALAIRLSQTTHDVVIGSRNSERGEPNVEAASWCDLAFVTVPFSARNTLVESMRDSLRKKVVIDTTVPVDPANRSRIRNESGKSAVEETADALKESEVFAAFQTVSFLTLRGPGRLQDVLVAGPSERKHVPMDIIRSMGLRPIYAGTMEIAWVLEGMGLLLISINKRNGLNDSSIKIEGVL